MITAAAPSVVVLDKVYAPAVGLYRGVASTTSATFVAGPGYPPVETRRPGQQCCPLGTFRTCN